MARTVKSGLEYFPFDIDFFQDTRIRKLIKCQGGKAVSVYTLLLCSIYKQGYYILWDDELLFICSELSGYGKAFITEVLKSCLTLGLFDKNLFDNENVLTSKGIQLRYSTVKRLNKRKYKIDKYRLLDDEPQPAPTEVPPPQPTFATLFTPVKEDGDDARWLNEFFAPSHSEQLRLLCLNYGMDANDIQGLRKLAEAVVNEWALSSTKHYDYSDWSRHLISCMRIKHRDTQTNQTKYSNETKQTDRYTRRRGADSAARSAEDYTDTF